MTRSVSVSIILILERNKFSSLDPLQMITGKSDKWRPLIKCLDEALKKKLNIQQAGLRNLSSAII